MPRKSVRAIPCRPLAKCGSRRSICSEVSLRPRGEGMEIDLAESRLAGLKVDIHSGVARFALANAPLNVIDISMMDELSRALAEIEQRTDISVIVLSSEGKGFSAGVDIAAHPPGKTQTILARIHAALR